jgi:hypothetical protein
MEGDATYFSRRASEERLAAMKAADPRARQAHLQLAQSYDDRASAIVAYRPTVTEKAS